MVSWFNLKYLVYSGPDIAILRSRLPPLLHSIGQEIQNTCGILPSDACVGDADTILETLRSLLGNLLVAYESVRLRFQLEIQFDTTYPR